MEGGLVKDGWLPMTLYYALKLVFDLDSLSALL